MAAYLSGEGLHTCSFNIAISTIAGVFPKASLFINQRTHDLWIDPRPYIC